MAYRTDGAAAALAPHPDLVTQHSPHQRRISLDLNLVSHRYQTYVFYASGVFSSIDSLFARTENDDTIRTCYSPGTDRRATKYAVEYQQDSSHVIIHLFAERLVHCGAIHQLVLRKLRSNRG